MHTLVLKCSQTERIALTNPLNVRNNYIKIKLKNTVHFLLRLPHAAMETNSHNLLGHEN